MKDLIEKGLENLGQKFSEVRTIAVSAQKYAETANKSDAFIASEVATALNNLRLETIQFENAIKEKAREVTH